MAVPGKLRSQPVRRPAFRPSRLSGLTCWFKADGTLWQDSARTTMAIADGDPVGSWDDASGNENHGLQATSGKRPLLKLGVLNGKPVVRFDGVDDTLQDPGAQIVGLDGTWTAFAVSTSTASTTQNVIDCDNLNIASRVAQFLRYSSATTVQSIAFNTAPGAFTDSVTTWSGFDLLEAVRDATSVEAFINGVGNGSTATTGTPQSATSLVTLGSSGNGPPTNFLTGDIAEAFIYNRALAAGERALVRAYLNVKYGPL